MKPGFYTIMAAQFFSSLADNALLIAAIALLLQIDAPQWMTPLLKLFFVVSYVLLAPYVGPFADSMPKGRVMFITNTIKVAGCLLMFYNVHPLAAYALVGLGAAAYSPAKYGILTELLPAEKLVVANGWIEGLTVSSIILGTFVGGALISPTISSLLLSFDLVPQLDTGIDTAPEAAMCVIILFYSLAAIFNLRIPDTGIRYDRRGKHPMVLFRQFQKSFKVLWADPLGQVSLAVTTLFWGAGATLQFIVLKWAETALNMPLNQGALLQGICAIGVAVGAVMAARYIPLRKSLRVILVGVAMGLVVMVMTQVTDKWVAFPLLIIIGGLSGFFVVPMNALLQHRGHVLMSAGQSIAIQNFNENLSVLMMLGLYALLIHLEFHVNTVIILFGSFVTVAMVLVYIRHRSNQTRFNVEARIGHE
ncbi:MAG: lysophospholipid transporter LplT [Burkholderiales bacterium]|nr:lysophospholipid transporter LplT [Burkholderiales bacterium]